MADDFGGDTAHDGTIGHILGDDCAGGNDRVVADGYAGVDDRAATNPNVIPDRDGLPEFLTRSAHIGIDRVGCRQDAHPRANQTIDLLHE